MNEQQLKADFLIDVGKDESTEPATEKHLALTTRYVSCKSICRRAFICVSVPGTIINVVKSVSTFLILQELKMLLSWDIRTVHYWSDGAASQFNNQYNFMKIAYHERDFDCAADWSFLCMAHSKGPVDGVGGETKRVVWRAILQGKETMTSPREF